MLEHNGYIQSSEDIKNALRRNKMQADRRIGLPPKKITPRDSYSEFLEVYVFNKLRMTPLELLRSLEHQYYSEHDFRQRRQKNIDYMRGRQMYEIVYDEELKRNITQFEYLKRRGIPHMTYNVISKLTRSLVGQFSEINTGNIVKCETKDVRGQELAVVLTEALNRNKKRNKAKRKDSRNMKEMLSSGRPVYKVFWGNKNNMTKTDVMFRNVNTAKFGMNPGITDEDFANLHTCYELHDTDLNSIIEMFAKGDYERGMGIREMYVKHQGDEKKQASYSSQSFNGQELRNITFWTQGVGNSSYRYIEVWNKISDFEASTYDPLEVPGNDYKVYKWQDANDVKKQIDEINAQRLKNSEGDVNPEDVLIRYDVDFRSRWYVSYITPWGYLLDVRESPYKTGVMPYVMPAPDINGEMWGLLEEVLPAQLSMDRQIMQADNIISNASKGVWMIPESAVPDDMSNKEYIREIKKTNGAVIVQLQNDVDPAVAFPKQVYANSANVSGQVQQMIQLYSGLVDEISGNYSAAQGKGTSSSTTASGYALETQNAGLNVRDLFETFLDVILQRDERMLMFMLEGYSKDDFAKVTGKEIDPKEFDLFEFSIEQSKGTNSPAHRMALEQELLQLVYNQLLPFEVFLDISNNPVMIQAKQKYEEYMKNQALVQGQQMNASPQGGQVGMAQLGNGVQAIAENTQVDTAQIADKAMKRVENYKL